MLKILSSYKFGTDANRRWRLLFHELFKPTELIKTKVNEIIASDEEEIIPFAENGCECALCKAINTIYVRWKGWTPSSEFEKMFMKHIEQMG